MRDLQQIIVRAFNRGGRQADIVRRFKRNGSIFLIPLKDRRRQALLMTDLGLAQLALFVRTSRFIHKVLERLHRRRRRLVRKLDVNWESRSVLFNELSKIM